MPNPLAAAWSYLRGDDLKRLDGVDLKASLAVGGGQPRGFWMGDPVTNGQWIDSGLSNWGWWRGNGAFDYRRAVGDGLESSIVVACLNAIAGAMPEPPPAVYQRGSDGDEEAMPQHELVRLLKRPNPYMSWERAAGYVAVAQHVAGAAYFWKGKSAVGRTLQLWPLPPNQIRPAWPDDATTDTWITHFSYRPDSRREAVKIPVDEIVYLPYQVDPSDLRSPRSPLAPVLREIFTDEEASSFLAALLNNYGVPPVILTPEPNAGGGPNKEQAQQIKNELKQRFGGDRRGEPMVTGAPFKVTVVGYSPADLNLDKLRQLPESRVCAVLGVPAIVAHLQVGLEHATYSNSRQLREHFIETKMIPYWRLLAADLTHALVPDFGGDETTLRIGFDLSDVRALQEDQDALYKRLDTGVRGGWIQPNEARRDVGLPEEGDLDGLYYVPINVTPTPAAEVGAPPEPAPQLPAPTGPRATVTPVPPPAKMRLLPNVKAVTHGQTIVRLRERLTKSAERDLARFLNRQVVRVVERLQVGMKAERSIPPTAEELVPDAEREQLTAALEAYYLRALDSMQAFTEEAFGIDFTLDDPLVRTYLEEAKVNIPKITEETRKQVRAALQEGHAAGEGVPELAARIQDLPAFNKQRAITIARTEIGEATNRAAMTSYEASGVVVGVEIYDQESDEICKGWNGRKLTLTQARETPLLFHPRCTQARAPIVDAAQLEGAA